MTNDDAARPVVVVGSYNYDLLFRTTRLPGPGETRLGEASFAHGGKGFNQAVAAARLGAPTVFIGALGNDSFAADVMAYAKAQAICACWQRLDEVPTGLASVAVDEQGSNQIVVAPGANARLSAAHVKANMPAEPAVILTQLECNREASVSALRHLSDSHAIGILNPAPVAPDVAGMLPDAAVITPNQTEFVQLLEQVAGISIAPDWQTVGTGQLHRWARRLGVDTVVITLGAAGCFVSHAPDSHPVADDPCYRVPGVPATAVDTTGAGDCFNGALAAALHRDPEDFRSACSFANRAAAFSVGRPGAAPSMPTLDDLS